MKIRSVGKMKSGKGYMLKGKGYAVKDESGKKVEFGTYIPAGVASALKPESKKIVMYKHNWSFEGNPEKGDIRVSLGNLSDAGWYWNGKRGDLAGFLVRIDRSQVKDEFLTESKESGLTYPQIKADVVKQFEKGEGIYEVSGDNKRWHFGETGDQDWDYEKDTLVNDLGYTSEQADKIIDDAQIEFSDADFDDFKKSSQFKDVQGKVVEVAKSSNSFSEFFSKMDSEDVAIGIEETMMNYSDEKRNEALNKAIGKAGKPKWKVEE